MSVESYWFGYFERNHTIKAGKPAISISPKNREHILNVFIPWMQEQYQSLAIQTKRNSEFQNTEYMYLKIPELQEILSITIGQYGPETSHHWNDYFRGRFDARGCVSAADYKREAEVRMPRVDMLVLLYHHWFTDASIAPGSHRTRIYGNANTSEFYSTIYDPERTDCQIRHEEKYRYFTGIIGRLP